MGQSHAPGCCSVLRKRGLQLKTRRFGANAVGIGGHRWGLAVFGQQGVERVLDIINAELRLAMVGCGTATLTAITPASIIDAARRG
jgi:isopentenyl diphosphate isomerase/L-lactate dehydrogenase-like FMN-dependent dehydrogenase